MRSAGDPDDPGPSALPLLSSPLLAMMALLPDDVEDVVEATFAGLFEVVERTWVLNGIDSFIVRTQLTARTVHMPALRARIQAM